MLFNSFGYLLFLAVFVPAIWLTPRSRKVYLVSAASMLFYSMWRWDFALLVIFSAAVDFFAVRQILKCKRPGIRKGYLLLSLTVNLGLLVFFKYSYFLAGNLNSLLNLFGGDFSLLDNPGFRIILPLGISFYTFQTVSYTIDAYRGVGYTTDNFVVFLAYVSFWPQLVAGPILRAAEMIPQLEKPRNVTFDDVATGLQRILFGLFKKVVIADNLAPIVDTAFNVEMNEMIATDVWAASILFGFQIYLDFSGYSDIAIGSGRLLGIEIKENFNWPYIATSPRDFWKRWHISLSSWIRDYLYLPLTGQKFRTRSDGGLEVAVRNDQRNLTWALFLTWFIMGLWHGAAWKFAVWGLYHAVFIYIYRKFGFLRNLPEKSPALAWLITFSVSMAGWIPFRAANLEQAFQMFCKLFNPFLYNVALRGVYGPHYLKAFLLIAFFLAGYGINKYASERKIPLPAKFLTNLVVCTAITVAVLIYLKPVEQFIYFQF